jgi:hypothetical protein
MRLLLRRASGGVLPGGTEYVPGIGVARSVGKEWRWKLAGEYATAHRLIGPWYRRVCASCGTRGRCAFQRWSSATLAAGTREWRGR